MQFEEEPLMIRGKGQGIKNVGQILEERLQRCDLELNRVLRLDEQITITDIDIKNLKSIFLEKNVQFKALVDELKQWNEDVKEYKNNKKTIFRAGFKFNLIKYLAQNLREIVNTKDRPPTQGGRVSTASRPGTTPYQNNVFSSMTLKDSNQAFFPTNNMEDYLNNHRSKHSNLDPPEDRIKEFTKRDLLDAPLSTAHSRPATVMFNSTRPLTQGSLARPSTNYQSLRLLSNVDMASRGVSRGGLASAQTHYQEGERLRSPGVINTSPWNYTGSFAFFQTVNLSAKPSPSPQIQNQFLFNKFSKIESKESMGKQGEEGEEGGEGQGMDQEEYEESVKEDNLRRTFQGTGILQPSRKAFHLDKNIEQSYAPHIRPSGDMKSTYLNYNPSDEIGEIRLENLWLQNRNKAVQEKREHEELENHIQTWATNKGLMDQEIDKKNEITAHGSNFQEIGVKINSKVPRPVLSEKNYLQKEMTAEEIEDQALFNNYINILKLPKEQKQQMANPSANDESIYEIALKIDQSIRTPKSQRSASRNFNDFQEQIQFEQLLDQSMTKNKKRNLAKKSSDIQSENSQPIVEERPKTMYVNLREQIKQKDQEQNPLIGMEYQIKKNKLALLRQTKGKIIGQSQTKLGEEADEEEIIRRKQQSLQIYHRQGHSQTNFRPFTSMYKRISQDNLRTEQLNEIEKVRKGFAKKGIKCSLKTISQSLSRPQGLPLNSLQLPAPGSMLFTNPFEQFSKKKSKKKKQSN